MTRLFALVLLASATVALWWGWTSEFIEIQTFVFWRESMSMWDALSVLREEGQRALFALVFAFTFIFPALKIALLCAALWLPRRMARGVTALVGAVGKWSMLDVMIVALFLVAVKSNGLGDVRVLEGVWYFVAAIFLSVLAQSATYRLVARETESPSLMSVVR